MFKQLNIEIVGTHAVRRYYTICDWREKKCHRHICLMVHLYTVSSTRRESTVSNWNVYETYEMLNQSIYFVVVVVLFPKILKSNKLCLAGMVLNGRLSSVNWKSDAWSIEINTKRSSSNNSYRVEKRLRNTRERKKSKRDSCELNDIRKCVW